MKKLRQILIAPLLLLATLVCLAAPAIAQEKIQVVTQTLDKRVPFAAGEVLRVDARKAIVEIQGWKENYIQLTLKLIAKHPQRQVAESDLQYLKYEVKKENNTHLFTNYFSTKASDYSRVRSNLKAHYQIKVPAGCRLNISNSYGNIVLEKIINDVDLTISFGELQLTDTKGTINISSSYGDIKADNISGNLICRAEKAEIHLLRASGSYEITNSYGQIIISATPSLTQLKIASSRTAVRVEVPSFEGYTYFLSTVFSDILLPGNVQKGISKNMAGKKTYASTHTNSPSSIQIATTFSPITIQLQSHAAQK